MHQATKMSVLISPLLNDDSEAEADGDDNGNKDNFMGSLGTLSEYLCFY
jgi:hypothetical protein